jgi:hypothetical protein
LTVGYVGDHKLKPEEQETHFNMTGDNHNEWVVFTDDAFWIARLDKLVKAGHVPEPRLIGAGKEYKLKANQVLVRPSPKQREYSAETAERLRQQGSLVGRSKATSLAADTQLA